MALETMALEIVALEIMALEIYDLLTPSDLLDIYIYMCVYCG